MNINRKDPSEGRYPYLRGCVVVIRLDSLELKVGELFWIKWALELFWFLIFYE